MQKGLTELVVILDKSGSMANFASDTIDGFNQFMRAQSAQAGTTKVTTILFDSRYKLLWEGIDSKQAVLTANEYVTGGRTALYDAIGRTITETNDRLSKIAAESKPEKVILLIMTDGEENESKEYRLRELKLLIELRKRDGWEFIFIGVS